MVREEGHVVLARRLRERAQAREARAVARRTIEQQQSAKVACRECALLCKLQVGGRERKVEQLLPLAGEVCAVRSRALAAAARRCCRRARCGAQQALRRVELAQLQRGRARRGGGQR